MTTDDFRQAVFFAILCIAQVLVLNHIHLFDCATPLLYVYMVTVFPLDYPKWGILLWSFAMGLTVDVFSNTPGVAAASLTLVGAVQPYYAKLFVSRDAPENLRPSPLNFGPTKFYFYIVTLVLLHCLLFFTLEAFNFFNWAQWIWCIVGSTVLTSVLILTIESARRK